jgi:hypothetical protein
MGWKKWCKRYTHNSKKIEKDVLHAARKQDYWEFNVSAVSLTVIPTDCLRIMPVSSTTNSWG